jgi:hypothetical protein
MCCTSNQSREIDKYSKIGLNAVKNENNMPNNNQNSIRYQNFILQQNPRYQYSNPNLQ